MIGWLYFIIIIIANTIGALAGIGGGVLIKPIFDAIGHHSLAAITFYSSCAVWMMSLVSSYRNKKTLKTYPISYLLYLGIGSILGGVLGNYLFATLLGQVTHQALVEKLQIILLLMTLIIAYILGLPSITHKEFRSNISFLMTSLLLGAVASFIGIGGGPMNVALLMYLFSFNIKEAANMSLWIILISQSSKLFTIGMTTGYQVYDLSMLYYIFPAAIIGGLLGSKLRGVLSERWVSMIYQSAIIGIVLLSIFQWFQL